MTMLTKTQPAGSAQEPASGLPSFVTSSSVTYEGVARYTEEAAAVIVEALETDPSTDDTDATIDIDAMFA